MISQHSPVWLAPTTLEEALALRAEFGDDATVLAGGTFIGILLNQHIMQPERIISLRHIAELASMQAVDEQRFLHIGAMTTHRAVEKSQLIRQLCPVLASTFALVANPRVRNQATVGGVLADADYASDPPTLLHAMNASVLVRSAQGQREIPVEDLILDHYQTALQPDELLIELRVPCEVRRIVYRKYRSRSSEDRPCVAVAAGEVDGRLRVVVGAVAERPQYFPEFCAFADAEAASAGTRVYSRELASEIGQRYAQAIQAISDARGSAEYRRRVIAVEVRRAIEELNQ